MPWGTRFRSLKPKMSWGHDSGPSNLRCLEELVSSCSSLLCLEEHDSGPSSLRCLGPSNLLCIEEHRPTIRGSQMLYMVHHSSHKALWIIFRVPIPNFLLWTNNWRRFPIIQPHNLIGSIIKIKTFMPWGTVFRSLNCKIPWGTSFQSISHWLEWCTMYNIWLPLIVDSRYV